MGHMRKRLARGTAAVAALAISSAALAACSSAEEPSSSEAPDGASSDAWLEDLEPITLRVADWTSGDAATGLYGEAMEGWAQRIEEATDGLVTAEFYYGTSLLTATDALPGLSDGVADIAVINSVYYPAELPVGTWMASLGANGTGSIVHDTGAGSATAFEWSQSFEPLQEEWEAHNLHPLVTVSSAPYPLICNTPVETLDDAQGLLARSSGAAWTPTIEALGMTTVNIAYNEIYEGLQRGVVDCITINANQLVSSMTVKDVAPYYHPVTFSMWQATNFMMNDDVWESFPVELQRIMAEEAGQAAHDIMNRFIELEALAGAAFEDGSATIVDAPELQAAADESREQILAAMVDSAPPSVEDPEQVIEDYSATFDRYVQVLVDEGYEIPGRDVDSVMQMFSTLEETDYSGLYEILKTEYIEPSLP
jgi:TRAP-type C4-dicarboxylate transport system substrate-binding protein